MIALGLVAIALAFVCGLVFIYGMIKLGIEKGAPASRPPPPPPPSPVRLGDELAPIVELIGQTVAQTAEAIGKAVSQAQYPQPEPPAGPRQMVWAADPDILAGDVDQSDPTDFGILHPNRPDVSFEEPPGGWPA